jgi:hypothetical protein
MVGGYALDSSDSRQKPAVRSCEHGNKMFGSIEGGDFLDYLSDYELHKKDLYEISTITHYF